MSETRKSTEDRAYWGSYIGHSGRDCVLGGLLLWIVSLGFHAQALAGIGVIVAIFGVIAWGAGMARGDGRPPHG